MTSSTSIDHEPLPQPQSFRSWTVTSPAQLRVLRAQLRHLASLWALPDDCTDRILMIVNELTSNAIDHARSTCAITVRHSKALVRVLVADDSPFPRGWRHTTSTPLAGVACRWSGRGQPLGVDHAQRRQDRLGGGELQPALSRACAIAVTPWLALLRPGVPAAMVSFDRDRRHLQPAEHGRGTSAGRRTRDRVGGPAARRAGAAVSDRARGARPGSGRAGRRHRTSADRLGQRGRRLQRGRRRRHATPATRTWSCAVLAAGNANDHRRTTGERPLADAIVDGEVRRIDLLRLTVGDGPDDAPATRTPTSGWASPRSWRSIWRRAGRGR